MEVYISTLIRTLAQAMESHGDKKVRALNDREDKLFSITGVSPGKNGMVYLDLYEEKE